MCVAVLLVLEPHRMSPPIFPCRRTTLSPTQAVGELLGLDFSLLMESLTLALGIPSRLNQMLGRAEKESGRMNRWKGGRS
jgi:hypothetical protein